MKRLHLYLIKSFLGPFFLAFAIAMIVLMLNFVWLYIDELVGKGLRFSVIAKLITYASAKLIPLAIVLGILLASVMTFGNLGEHNELTALKSSGISLVRTMTPVLFLAIFLGIASSTFSNYIYPTANTKFFSLLYEIRKQRPEIDIKEGQFYNGIEGYSLYIGHRSKDGKTLYDLMIYNHTKSKENVGVTLADSGYMRINQEKESIVLDLYSGYYFEELLDKENEIQDTRPIGRTVFSNQKVVYRIPGSELLRGRNDRYQDLYLKLRIKQLRDTALSRNAYMIWDRNKVGHKLLEQKYLSFENKKEVRENPEYYERQTTSIDPREMIMNLSDSDKGKVYAEAMNLARSVQSELYFSQNNVEIRTNREKVYWNELYRKLVYGLACVIFFLVGAPLGAILRKGGLGTPVLVSIVLFILFYMLTTAGEKLAIADFVPTWAGMWISSMILFPVGIFLTIKSNQDSELMSTESYLKILRKVSGIIRLKRKRVA